MSEPFVVELKLTQAERELLLFALATLRWEYRHHVVRFRVTGGVSIVDSIDTMRDRLKSD